MNGESALSRREVARRKMIAFYARYFPEKVAQVDFILDQYPGREDAVIRAMQIKYPTWNSDYLPPDLSSILGSVNVTPQAGRTGRSQTDQQVVGQHIQVHVPGAPNINILPTPQHETQITVSPKREGRELPAPGYSTPVPHHPSQQPTREELHDVVSTLHHKLTTQQRREMSSLENKLEQLMSLARQDPAPQRPLQHQQRQAALETLKAQVDNLSRVVQAHNAAASPQRQLNQQHDLQQLMVELDELKAREAQRVREHYGELDRVRRENQQLREEGEEGRELIMELHSVVEQLRHANQAKTSEIEGLLKSAQTLKQHYEQTQGRMKELQQEYEREKARMAMSLHGAVGTSYPLQQQSPLLLSAPPPIPPNNASAPALASPPAPLPPSPQPYPVQDTQVLAKTMEEQFAQLQDTMQKMRHAQQQAPQQQFSAPYPIPSASPMQRGAMSPPRPGRAEMNFDHPNVNAGYAPHYAQPSNDLLDSLRRRTQQNLATR